MKNLRSQSKNKSRTFAKGKEAFLPQQIAQEVESLQKAKASAPSSAAAGISGLPEGSSTMQRVAAVPLMGVGLALLTSVISYFSEDVRDAVGQYVPQVAYLLIKPEENSETTNVPPQQPISASEKVTASDLQPAAEDAAEKAAEPNDPSTEGQKVEDSGAEKASEDLTTKRPAEARPAGEQADAEAASASVAPGAMAADIATVAPRRYFGLYGPRKSWDGHGVRRKTNTEKSGSGAGLDSITSPVVGVVLAGANPLVLGACQGVSDAVDYVFGL